MQCTSKLNTPCTYTPQQSKQKMNDTQKINKIIIQTKKTKNSNARKAKVFTISTSAVPADTSEGFMGSLFLIAPLWADSGINLSGALSKKHMQLWKKISEVVTVGGKKKKEKKKKKFLSSLWTAAGVSAENLHRLPHSCGCWSLMEEFAQSSGILCHILESNGLRHSILLVKWPKQPGQKINVSFTHSSKSKTCVKSLWLWHDGGHYWQILFLRTLPVIPVSIKRFSPVHFDTSHTFIVMKYPTWSTEESILKLTNPVICHMYIYTNIHTYHPYEWR